jgi:hypothetical protein
MATGRKAIATVNDLTREALYKACESLHRTTKGSEVNPKRFTRQLGGHKSNRLIDAKMSFYGTYVLLNEQVTLQNQDPRLYRIN